MKVILKSKIKKLGNIGDVVDVKDGYARNMLIPNELALFYTDKNYEIFKVKKAEIEAQNQENKVKAEELKSKIIAKEIILIENAGDDGKLYGSISGVKLANHINSLLKITTLKKVNIFIKDPIKTVGKFSIIIELHPEVIFDKEVITARSKDEAIRIKKNEFSLKKEELISDDISNELISNVGSFKKDKFNKEISDEKTPKKNSSSEILPNEAISHEVPTIS